jgi:hypothetical protein
MDAVNSAMNDEIKKPLQGAQAAPVLRFYPRFYGVGRV